ncbi:MAG TPA: peptidoglycan DD-metalloendopeptidase family protein [Longimicrobiales bacterium]|nr:peptidoglycan DD-metalloendopeptidase family protein [Longimicrobiales bacterium]
MILRRATRIAGMFRSDLRTWPARAAVLATVLLVLPVASPASAQTPVQRDLRDSRAKLDSIQAERQRLQRDMDQLQTRVRDASRELLNIERQREFSRSALLEIEFQAQLLNEDVEKATREHEATQERLRLRIRVLNERIRSIYKRGRAHTAQVLLSSSTFGDLLNRYKYLHLMALYDRMVVQEVARLERDLAAQERELRESLARVDRLREERAEELAQLERVEQQRQAALRQFRQQETRTAGRLTELEREQERLTGAIADLERRRLAEEARGATPTAVATISTRDLGTLPWPVDGSVVYRFGPDRKPDGIILKNQGIGIGAPAGTPVRAVESGVVEFAGAFPGYGPTVIISHGAGYRTLYLYLRDIGVRVGQQVAAGEHIGAVGGEQTREGAHIEFQVRVPMAGSVEPVDPLAWLRARAGGTDP